MSYKHLDQIQSLYESVSEIENSDNELVNEIITVVATSMFAEGYTNTAIKGYFNSADPVDVVEKYDIYSENFLFVDEKTLTEDVEHDLVLDEESLAELNLIIEGIAGIIGKGLKRVLAPTMRTLKGSTRNSLKKIPGLKAVYPNKATNAVKSGVKAVSKKADDAAKWTGGANPAGKPSVPGTKGGALATISKTKTKVKDAVTTGAKSAKDKVGEVVKNVKTAAKTPKASAKNAFTKAANFVKKNKVATAGTVIGGGIGLGLVGGGKNKSKSKKKESMPIQSVEKQKENDTHTDAQGKKYPSTAEIRAKHSKASSTGNAGSSTDSGGTAGKTTVTPKPEAKASDTSEKDAWLKKTRNSPAAKSGAFSDDQRWAQQLKHRKWQKENKRGKYKESYDAFDIVSNYLIDSNQVDGMDEALYVMTEMDAQTIQGIVEDFKKKA